MGNCNSNSKSLYAYRGGASEKAPPTRPSLHEGPILAVQPFRSDSFLTCGDDKEIVCTHLSSFLANPTYSPQHFSGHSKAVNRIEPLSQSTFLSCSRDLSLRRWNADSGDCDVIIQQAHSLNIAAICREDANRVFSGSRDYSVKQWDLPRQECISERSSPRNIVTSMCYSASQHILYQGAEDLCVRGWDTRDSTGSVPSMHFAGYVYFPLCLVLHSNENTLVSGCKGFNSVGCGVIIWDVRQTARPVHEFQGHSQDVTCCMLLPSHPDIVVTGSKDGTLRAWNCHTLSALDCLSLGRRPISSVCAAPGGGILATAMDGCLAVISVSSDGGGNGSIRLKLSFITSSSCGSEDGAEDRM